MERAEKAEVRVNHSFFKFQLEGGRNGWKMGNFPWSDGIL